jgi:hypothetical protein
MRTRHLTVAGLLASMLAVGLITGCAQGTGTPLAGGSSGVASSPSASASGGAVTPSSAPSVPADPGSSAKAAGSELTLNGQIETGVEASCLILRSNGATYELMGGDKNVVKAGNNVVVTGHLVTGIMSHCMQGKPFEITQAHLA